jgi:hypothetical protein
MVRAYSAARPAAGTNKASSPPSASRTAKNGTVRPGCPAHQSDEQSRRRITGQNGRRSAKRAVIRTSFRPDPVRHMSVATATHRPAVTHPDTWRDEKETARRAAFPQQGGRFRRWWQVWVRTRVGEADGFTDRRLLVAVTCNRSQHSPHRTRPNAAQYQPPRGYTPADRAGHPAAARGAPEDATPRYIATLGISTNSAHGPGTVGTNRK